MKASVLGGTTAAIVAISLLCTVSHANMLPNCTPEYGDIETYDNRIYIQPEIDEKGATLYSGTAKRYNKTFTFTSPCHLLFKAISLMYFGSCSVAVSYGSDNRVLEIIQFPDPLTTHWHSRNVSLTKSASQSLHSFMKRSNTSKLLITISPGISHCQLYPVDHNRVKGLVIFGHVVPTFVSPSSVTNTAITTNVPSSRASTIQTSFTTTPLVESTSKIAKIDSDSSGLSLVTSIVIPLVLLAVLLGVFILMLLVRSGTFLSKSSHPWIIAVRRSTSPKNMPDPRNQFYQNHDGTDRVYQSPAAELRDPGLYSSVGPGYGNPTNRPQTPPGARNDRVTDNESFMYATCDGAAPMSYVNTETRQKDACEP
eukprot:scpid84874/ scgid1187/ 